MELDEPKMIASEISRLRKSGKINEASLLGENALTQFPENWSIRNALAWVIYDKDVKTAKEGNVPPDKLPGILGRVKELQSHSLYGEISAYVLSVLELSRVLKDANLHSQALALLEEVDRTQLSSESNSAGGQFFPSQKSRFYSLFTKLLIDTGRFDEAVNMCDEALASPALKSEGERKWFRYRRALALEKSNPSEALNEISRFLKLSREWWAIQIRARLLGSIGRVDECLVEYAHALGGVDSKELDKAVKLITEYALMATDVEMRKDLLQSVRSIRLSESWKASPEIERAAAALGLGDAHGFDHRAALTRHSTQNAPAPSGGKARESHEENVVLQVASGKVKRLLEGNPQGFLEVEALGDCYFRASDNPKLNWPPPIGQLIYGKVVESFDASKGRTSKKFINGSPIRP